MANKRVVYRSRKSLRLPEWDYRAPAAYFVTACTHHRAHLFSHPPFADIAAYAMERIPTQKHAAHVKLDEWVIMPNHIHVIFIFMRYPDQQCDLPMQPKGELRNALAGSLGVIVAQYKRAVTKRINLLRKTSGGKVWQRGYYEHIIRNERAYRNIQRYIRDNPRRWAADRENIDRLTAEMTPHQ